MPSVEFKIQDDGVGIGCIVDAQIVVFGVKEVETPVNIGEAYSPAHAVGVADGALEGFAVFDVKMEFLVFHFDFYPNKGIFFEGIHKAMLEAILQKRDKKQRRDGLFPYDPQDLEINPDLTTLPEAFEVNIILQVANFFT